MDAQEWLAAFAARDAAWLAAREDFHKVVGARIAAALHPAPRAAVAPLVLEAGHDVELDDERAPASARRAANAGLGAGWSTRLVRSVAAVSSKGVLTVFTVRCARHDERMWAAWWNGAFECAQYYRQRQQVESLGWDRLVAARTEPNADELRALARAAGIKVPAKAKKADVAALTAHLVAQWAPVMRRGVLDAIEGLQLPVTRQVV